MRGKEAKEKTNTSMKIQFYIMSLCLLFILIFLLTVDVPLYFGKDAQFIGLLPLLKRNWIAFPSLILALVGWLIAKRTEWKWKGVSNPSYEIVSVRNENYEYLTFLTTYIIPLICIDLTQPRYVFILVLLLIIIGFIFVKMDLYYGNPTLALMGYKLYRAEIKKSEDCTVEVVLISKQRLTENSSIKWIYVDKNVWVAKEINQNDSR